MTARGTHADPGGRRCVVIVTYNSEHDISSCLSALGDEDVIVVDNASSDATPAIVAARGGRTRVIQNRTNLGFGAAANQGFRAAADADVVLVNPDVVLLPAALDQLADTARRTGAGLVAPRLTYPDGKAQASARAFPTLCHLLGRRTVLRHTSLGRRWHRSYLESEPTWEGLAVDWVIGAVMYLPRPSIDVTGGFDERFFLYGEDVDLCARLWRAGLPVLVESRATAVHRYGRASKRTFDVRQAATRHHWASILRLARRYPRQFFLNRPMDREGGPQRHPETMDPGKRAHERMESLSTNVGQPGRRPHLRGEVALPRLALERASQMVRLYDNWPTAMADRLRLLRRPQHVLYRVRSGDRTAALIARANGCDVRTIGEIWIGGLYDRLMEAGLPSGRRPLIVDIGANCGYFAVYVARRHPDARLVCFEPEPENRSLARANLALNGVPADLRSEAVVVDRTPTVTLNLSADPRLHTTVSVHDATSHGIDVERYSGRTVVVPAVNVNDAIGSLARDDRIDLLKVDVEGIDLELLGALDEANLAQIDNIVAETEGRAPGHLGGRLEMAGFHVYEDAELLFASRQPVDGRSHLEGVSSP
jgi:N-acetylglucosaminyl-diphospho-decaprenol L-rhamnosyltransferase